MGDMGKWYFLPAMSMKACGLTIRCTEKAHIRIKALVIFTAGRGKIAKNMEQGGMSSVPTFPSLTVLGRMVRSPLAAGNFKAPVSMKVISSLVAHMEKANLL